MTATRAAVLFDFGGVLTSSVVEAFGALGESMGDRRLPLRLLATDEESKRLLAAHEEGRIPAESFEEGFAARLRAHGADAPSAGLLMRLQAAMRPDRDMIDLVSSVRADGYRVGLLSNSLGDHCYAGFDLAAMFDAVVISAEIGARKPSRVAYRVACERLGVQPDETVMVDDLEQNIVAAQRLGLAGVVHRDATATARELADLLGT
jgi:putative hydrolase of the HAD superfamily